MPGLDATSLAALTAAVPRYTSYPTAPHFTPSIGNLHYVDWLQRLPDDAALSIYVHVPFCHELCWYCGCNTKAARRQAPVERYLDAVAAEVGQLADLVPKRHRVRAIHWGGGSPNIMTPAQIRGMSAVLTSSFTVVPGAEIAVEIDPRHIGAAVADALCDAGTSRISIGVQDLDPMVQQAINRQQSFATTEAAVRLFRDRGVTSINIDLVYGLPYQTMTTLEHTIGRVVALAPDRIAAFGYAHLPSRFKHQRLIPSDALPGPLARFQSAAKIGEMLVSAGYVRIGMDHFAKPGDALAGGRLHRNFQGYTTDDADALIGIGASAIGRVGAGYVQNAATTHDYMAKVARNGLAIARGLRLSTEDSMRAFAIERLMCDLAFPSQELRRRFGSAAALLDREAAAVLAGDRSGWLIASEDGFRVTDRGRPFLRSICARFDAYLGMGTAQHSVAV